MDPLAIPRFIVIIRCKLSTEVASGASHNHDMNVGQATDHHDSADDGTDTTLNRSQNIQTGNGITCHPCCGVSVGLCATILSDLPELPERILVRTFGDLLLVSFRSQQTISLLHPPELYVA